MKKLPAGIITIFFTHIAFLLPAQDINQYIRDRSVDSVAWFLEQGNPVNGLYPDRTLMELAIKVNASDIVRLLLERNANPDMVNYGNTPLANAIYYSGIYNDTTIIHLLIEHGADLNKPGRNNATPLIYACMLSNYPAARSLFLHGADRFLSDNHGHDCFFYVLRGSDFNLLNFFLKHGYSIPPTTSVSDGPYMKWLDDKTATAGYIKYDSLHNKAVFISDTVRVSHENFHFNNRAENKTETIPFNRTDHQQSVFENVKRIFVIGDIHGDYDSFTALLKGNHIVNDKLTWNWGEGHLVICGDVFDRGEQVLDCLWLIYKLESQAEKAGGKVHYILGNHEMMIMFDDNKNYVNDRLIYTCDRIGINYHDLFSNDYVLGQWLRDHNTAIKINNLLFIHGGIPPEYPGMKVTLEQMNSRIRDILKSPADSVDDMIYHFAIRPLWYRGYFEKRDQADEINLSLRFYGVDHILVGHTPVKDVSVLHGGSVIATNVPFELRGVKPEALLITGNKFYRVDENGNRYNLEVF